MTRNRARSAAVTGWKLLIALFATIGVGLTITFYGMALNAPEWVGNLLLGVMVVGIVLTLFDRPRRFMAHLTRPT